jgi:hypothetical protein
MSANVHLLPPAAKNQQPEPRSATYLKTGLVPRLRTAVLCTALMLFGVLLLACAIILDAVTKSRVEQKRFAYLAVPAYVPSRGDA